MARRLALLADDNHEGAWIRASGDEAAARVRGLGPGDHVWMTVITPNEEIRIPLEEGTRSLLGHEPRLWSRYKVSKIIGSSRLMTSVEVVLG